jgi:hypothetical protein
LPAPAKAGAGHRHNDVAAPAPTQTMSDQGPLIDSRGRHGGQPRASPKAASADAATARSKTWRSLIAASPAYIATGGQVPTKRPSEGNLRASLESTNDVAIYAFLI